MIVYQEARLLFHEIVASGSCEIDDDGDGASWCVISPMGMWCSSFGTGSMTMIINVILFDVALTCRPVWCVVCVISQKENE